VPNFTVKNLNFIGDDETKQITKVESNEDNITPKPGDADYTGTDDINLTYPTETDVPDTLASAQSVQTLSIDDATGVGGANYLYYDIKGLPSAVDPGDDFVITFDITQNPGIIAAVVKLQLSENLIIVKDTDIVNAKLLGAGATTSKPSVVRETHNLTYLSDNSTSKSNYTTTATLFSVHFYAISAGVPEISVLDATTFIGTFDGTLVELPYMKQPVVPVKPDPNKREYLGLETETQDVGIDYDLGLSYDYSLSGIPDTILAGTSFTVSFNITKNAGIKTLSIPIAFPNGVYIDSADDVIPNYGEDGKLALFPECVLQKINIDTANKNAVLNFNVIAPVTTDADGKSTTANVSLSKETGLLFTVKFTALKTITTPEIAVSPTFIGSGNKEIKYLSEREVVPGAPIKITVGKSKSTMLSKEIIQNLEKPVTFDLNGIFFQINPPTEKAAVTKDFDLNILYGLPSTVLTGTQIKGMQDNIGGLNSRSTPTMIIVPPSSGKWGFEGIFTIPAATQAEYTAKTTTSILTGINWSNFNLTMLHIQNNGLILEKNSVFRDFDGDITFSANSSSYYAFVSYNDYDGVANRADSSADLKFNMEDYILTKRLVAGNSKNVLTSSSRRAGDVNSDGVTDILDCLIMRSVLLKHGDYYFPAFPDVK
jgi:hypothetical protein